MGALGQRLPHVPRFLLVILLASTVAVPVVALVVATGWQGVYGQDAYWYHAYAVGEVRPALQELRAPGPFEWPPGYPILVGLVSLGSRPDTMAGQLVSLVAGASVPVMTWLLARELRPMTGWASWVAPLSGALVAVTPHLWQSSAVVMSDTTALVAATAGAWAMVRSANDPRARWPILGVAALALAVDTRLVYAVVALPLVVGWTVTQRRRARAAGTGWVRALAWPLVAGLLVLAPMIGPMAWAALAGEVVPFAVQLRSHSWHPANILRSETVGADGLNRYPLPMGLFTLLEPVRPYHLGPLAGVLSGLGWLRACRRWRTPMAVAVLVAWPALVLALLAGGVTQNTRFLLTVLPPLSILAGAGLDGLVGRVGTWRRGPRRSGVLVLGTLMAASLLIMALAAWRFTDAFIGRFGADHAAIAALAARVPAADRLIAFGATLALRFDGREVLELYELGPDGALQAAAGAGPTWLLLPRDGLASQWAAEPPGLALVALRDGPGVEPIASAGDWELWRVATR